MSEIEKLYKNAGIDLFPSCHNCNRLDEYWNNGSYNETCKDDKSIYECKKTILKYPEFTAEKQLELIKWLISKYQLEINNGRYTTYYMCNHKKYTSSSDDDFTLCLINLMNKIRQDLTPEEKQQVKGILE